MMYNPIINKKKTVLLITSKVFTLSLFLLFVLILAAMPLVFIEHEGGLMFRFHRFVIIPEYLSGLITGESLICHYDTRTWHVLDKLPSYFVTSLFYLSASSLIGVLVGFPIGMMRYKKRVSISQEIILFINSIPDFLMIIILQIFVIFVNITFGFRIAKIGMTTSPPILLPLIAMSIYPALYLIRQISIETFDVTCQDYILYAKSKGLSRFYIFKNHIVPALLPQLYADSTKIILLILSNMFIAEQLFRLDGITRMLFIYGFQRSYQYSYVVNSILSLFLMYLITRSFIWLILGLFTKIRGL